ncbi:hypothetical protein SAMN00808754_1488 [Thermanaeromonas toyohensis ToBE]|uniref:Uncharacterized protein n=2 Tax=Thermanaeromonas TaxID=202949 RepID=A0A1W1VSY0_9FIRM|nr:hypothetical protein SAMN00808754_1488 [Thermanaeromonas toyohensis ToBE]
MSQWLQCYLQLAPWLTFAIFVLGLLPGYFWWLITGSLGAARAVLLASLKASFVVGVLNWAVAAFLLPFWAFSGVKIQSSSKECWAFAVLGAWLLGCVAVLGIVLATGDALLSARVGTAVFFAGIPAGRALQKVVQRHLERDASSGQDKK